MGEARRKFDRDFREGAVRLVRETLKPIAQVAGELGSMRAPLATSVCREREEVVWGSKASSEVVDRLLVRGTPAG
jgi:transposase-like protein